MNIELHLILCFRSAIMKQVLLIIFILSTTRAFAQETGTYQADSTYKSNSVKLRKWYRGTNKKGGTVMYYDKKGRLTRYEIEMNLGASIRTTHYLYNDYGLLISMVDSTSNSTPDKKEIKRLKKLGINPSLLMTGADLPELEISKYELEYNGDQLVKQIKYSTDGSLEIVDVFEQDGKIQRRDWYRNGKLYRNSSTEYLTKFHKEKYYGWEIEKDGSKREWNYSFKYQFNEQRNVISFTRFDGDEEKETVAYTYDSRGLLTGSSGYYSEFFEYEYYK